MEALAQLSTLKDFIRYAVSQFNQTDLYYGHGTHNAWDEAIALVLQTLSLPHETHQMFWDSHLIDQEKLEIYKNIQKRINERLPLPYITHEAWFANLAFYVDQRVLIPRSPLAELIINQFQPWVNMEEVHSILDLCTGSGCIAIACAYYFPETEVDASDISEEALAVAATNVAKHGVREQVHLYQANLFAGLPDKKYDLIISNPPYVDKQEMAQLPPEFKHEPSLGLAAGKEGLDIISAILKNAARYLFPKGVLIAEVGASQPALSKHFPDVPFIWLECERGGDGVFMLRYEDLLNL